MQEFRVINTLRIREKTSVLIDGRGDLFAAGTTVLDENNNSYKVLSVGMSAGASDVKYSLGKTSLLLEGEFRSGKIYV